MSRVRGRDTDGRRVAATARASGAVSFHKFLVPTEEPDRSRNRIACIRSFLWLDRGREKIYYTTLR